MQQEPFDLGPNAAGFAQWAFNVLADRMYSTESVGKGLARVLATAGVATYGTDLFISSEAKVPTGTGPYLVVTVTPGAPPLETHGAALPRMLRPGAQVLAVAKDDEGRTIRGASAAAEAKAREAFAALGAVVNLDVVPV